MAKEYLVYIIFAIVLALALVFDLGAFSKKNTVITIKQALLQTAFWVSLALLFSVFIWWQEGQKPATEYLSAYLMEWSLSTDNIFVFILIFDAFRVKEKHYPRVLITGILMAIACRVVFITIGITAVYYAWWILYVFGVFLIYTGYRMFFSDKDDDFNPYNTIIYKFIKKYLALTASDGDGKYFIRRSGKKLYTSLFVVIILLAAVDVLFALDSIPAVLGISTSRMVIYTSNIFAVLGLRSLFFMLRDAIGRFKYLPRGIAIILFFIGFKMLAQHWIDEWVGKEQQSFISLGVILFCLAGSVIYSIFRTRYERQQP